MLRKFEARIERAGKLARVYPFASEILAFYSNIASYQARVYERLNGDNITDLLPHFPELLRLVGRVGPSGLANASRALAQQEDRWTAMLRAYWTPDDRGATRIDELELVLVRAMLQPFAEYLADRSEIQSNVVRNTCPFCDELPQAGVLRPEGEGARRSLICGLCSTEWQFRRTLCPNCGEEAIDKLPVYTAAEFEHIRIESCDTCKTYLTSIDLTKDGHAVPIVDELAALPMSGQAEDKGYRKIFPNLLGL